MMKVGPRVLSVMRPMTKPKAMAITPASGNAMKGETPK